MICKMGKINRGLLVEKNIKESNASECNLYNLKMYNAEQFKKAFLPEFASGILC